MELSIWNQRNFFNKTRPSVIKKIIIVGLNGVGKTTILSNGCVKIILSAFEIHEVQINTKLQIRKVNDQLTCRPSWISACEGCHSLIYVVDINDRKKLDESQKELFSILEQEEMKEVPVVVLANKQDLPNPMSLNEIINGLELWRLDGSRLWNVRACSAVSGDGLIQAMVMFVQILEQFKSVKFFEFHDRKSGTFKIVMVGLDGAGKTSIINKLKFNRQFNTIPTETCNVESVKIRKNIKFEITDIGGGQIYRSNWIDYCVHSHCVFYVVDINDRKRLKESKDALIFILEQEEMKEVPVVVLANKEDLPDPMSLNEIINGLELWQFDGSRRYCVQPCSAVSGDGLIEALQIAMFLHNPI